MKKIITYDRLHTEAKRLVYISLLLIFFISAKLYSQNGSISGKITDAGSNEVLIGANVLVTGTLYGASTDIDGFYSIKNLHPGLYEIKITYISYQTTTVGNITVNGNQNVVINIALNPSSTELEEVVITADALKNSEVSVLKIQQKSEGIVDGVSSELISKNNSTDGTDVLKRMTGVTISEGKFSYIRGVSDRYNNTMLNGANLPSTDPEKKSFSYDIFPASLIENIVTSKTFTPDKPGDFSGGLVQISTIEFPSDFTLDMSYSATYQDNTTGNQFLSYKGGSKDFLGYDDGTRMLPSLIGDQKITRGNYTTLQLADIGRSFKNNWNTSTVTPPINGSMKITLGDKLLIGENIFGFIGSLTYSNSFNNKMLEQSSYTFEGERYNYKGHIFSESVMLSGLLNFSYKFGQTNKLSFKNVFNQNSDDEVTQYEGFYRYADQYRKNTTFRFVSRTLLSNQLIGEHQFGLFNGLNLQWNVGYANSERNEPDARRYIYARSAEEPDAPLLFLLDQSLATRYFGKLDDNNYNASADLTIKLFENPDFPKLKFGYNYELKKREFDARLFGFRNRGISSTILEKPVEEIFTEENFGPNLIEVIEITKPSDSYNSEQTINAVYLMTDFRLFEELRLVAGLRYEYSEQIMNSFADAGGNGNVSENYSDFLPAVNLTFTPEEQMNFRLAFSTTLARPEFRELSSFTYFDFVTNELVIGNPKLKRSLINNYDFRYEYFSGPGELIAIGLFYKKFADPIEQILVASSSFEPIRSYQNANSAETYGVEFEIRKSLAFILNDLKNLSFISNLSLIKSKIKLESASISSTEFKKTERPLQGQADYTLNLGLYYDNHTLGLNSSIVYNKVGLQILRVGFAGLGDVIEKPRDLLDFSISKKFFQNFSIKLTIRDLFNQDKIYIQKTPNGDRVSELSRFGRSYNIGLSYQI
jgi:outer membrane receptor protein involved in Fe transport